MNTTLATLKMAAASAAAFLLVAGASHAGQKPAKSSDRAQVRSAKTHAVAAKNSYIVPVAAPQATSAPKGGMVQVSGVPSYRPTFMVTSPYHLGLKNKNNLR